MSKPVNTILAVEDSPILLTTLKFSLEKQGYQVKTATNGLEALEQFQKNQPIDLILMDADMPVLDGISACEKIRSTELGQNIPVIMVTGYGERDWVDRAYAAGVTDYVMKPINWDVLRNRIEYILSAKRAETALFDEKEKAQITLESIGDGVITTNAKQQVEYLNPIASKLTGWQLAQAQGEALLDVFNLIDKDSKQRLNLPYVNDTSEVIAEQVLLQHKDKQQTFVIEHNASPLRSRHGETLGMVLVFHDVTERQRMAESIAYQASHDALTHLYNRREFEKHLKQLCLLTEKKERVHSLLYLDLDRFKIVNDTCGHKSGDVLLQQLSQLLQRQVRKGDIVARLGGDEFGFLLQHCPSKQALRIAEQICQHVAEFKFSWDNHVFSVGASIGIVEINTEQHNHNKLLVTADHACLAAKRAGRGQVQLYKDDEDQDENKPIHWLNSIKEGLAEDKFCLLQQKIYDLDHRVRGHEFFLRLYRKESEELLLPDTFLSAAERYELSAEIDAWVITKLTQWLTMHVESLPTDTLFFINICNQTLGDGQFAALVVQKLQQQPLPLPQFYFEFNEMALSTELSGLQHFINTLKPYGCHFGLDQFGTGAIMLNSLKTIPFDFIKISGQLIQNISKDPVDKVMVAAIQQLAQQLNLKTIATTVEDDEILPILKQLKIDYVQGFELAQPLPLTHMLEQS